VITDDPRLIGDEIAQANGSEAGSVDDQQVLWQATKAS